MSKPKTTETIRVVYRSGGTSRMICILVLIGLCLTFLNVACILSPLFVVVVESDNESERPSSSLRQPQHHASSPPMCAHMQELYGSTDIEDVLRQADKFHNGGGSLKAVQKYLDQQVPQTMKRLEMSYKPLDKKEQEGFDIKNAPPVDEYLQDYYYASHDSSRSGYNEKLPVKFSGPTFRKTLHKDKTRARWMDVLESWDHERFEVAVGPVLPECPHMTTISEGSYENKSFCSAKEATPASDCHIISIGSNDQWSFEEEVLSLHPECRIYTFDCTLDGPPKNKPNDERIHFYPYCVSGDSDEEDMEAAIKTGAAVATQEKTKRNYKPYRELVQATGIVTTPPKVLKMDVEGFEYDVLSSMLDATPAELWPQQIMMEVHYATRMVDLEWMLRTRQTAEMAMFFDLLYHKGGYMPANVKYTEGCPTCMEILMVRVHCAEEEQA